MFQNFWCIYTKNGLGYNIQNVKTLIYNFLSKLNPKDQLISVN